jgi:hypothetical protein
MKVAWYCRCRHPPPAAGRVHQALVVTPAAALTQCGAPHRACSQLMETLVPPLGDLGWQGRFSYDSREVAELRQQLQEQGGIPGLEIVDPAQPDFARTVARLFHRDGFALLKDALSPERQARIQEGCDAVIRRMVSKDPARLGNRGSHRYSFGSAPAHFGYASHWASLIDPPAVLDCVEAIFESPMYQCSGYGGDFVLPGCVEFQQLHRDMGDYLHDPTGRLSFLDMPCSTIVVNYPTVPGGNAGQHAHTVFNGATRQIAGTQQSHAPIPSEAEEPLWMKLATTAPAPPGVAMFRDIRCWHGGTPNLSRHVRAIPSASYTAPWFNPGSATNSRLRSLPKSVYDTLSSRGRAVAAGLALDKGEVLGLRWVPDWDVDAGVGGGGPSNAAHQGLKVSRL